MNLLETDSLHHNIDTMGDVLAEVHAVKPRYEELKQRSRKLLEKGVGGELCGEVLPNIDDKVRNMQRNIPLRIKVGYTSRLFMGGGGSHIPQPRGYMTPIHP